MPDVRHDVKLRGQLLGPTSSRLQSTTLKDVPAFDTAIAKLTGTVDAGLDYDASQQHLIVPGDPLQGQRLRAVVIQEVSDTGALSTVTTALKIWVVDSEGKARNVDGRYQAATVPTNTELLTGAGLDVRTGDEIHIGFATALAKDKNYRLTFLADVLG